MAAADALHDVFIDELQVLYDCERQLIRALTKLAKTATAPSLRDTFESHLEETEEQMERLEQVFDLFDEKVRGSHCEGIAGIIEEGKAMMEKDVDPATMDACLIAVGQRAEHYEIAAYGTLIAWAEAMGQDDVVNLLGQTLDEEEAAGETFSSLAEDGVDQARSTQPVLKRKNTRVWVSVS